MNTRFLNIVGLLTCFTFLAGNIAYDFLDKTDPDCFCYGAADYRLFYLPMSLLMMWLIFMAYDASKKSGGAICIMWWGFLWLAIGQVIKFIGFNPFVTMVSDYLFLAIVVIGTIIKLCLLKQKS